jgi:hypothetical protein
VDPWFLDQSRGGRVDSRSSSLVSTFSARIWRAGTRPLYDTSGSFRVFWDRPHLLIVVLIGNNQGRYAPLEEGGSQRFLIGGLPSTTEVCGDMW